MKGGVLVAGIGNVFQADDAFGVEVASRLAARTLPPGVRVEDFGIRGVHLANELLERLDPLILIDAVPTGDAPGTLAVISPRWARTRARRPKPGQRRSIPPMSPDVVLATLSRLGGSVGRIRIVGCQPARPPGRRGAHPRGRGRGRHCCGAMPRTRC